MRSTAAIVSVLLAGALVAAAETKLVIYPAPAGQTASDDYTLEVNGQPVFVYTAQTLKSGPASFAYFDFAGTAQVKAMPKVQPAKAVVRPLARGITPAIEGNTVTFALAKPCQVSLELNETPARPLLIFANPLEVDAPKPDDPNVLYFGPGVHEVGTTQLKSGQTLYVAGGAVVRGKILPDEKPVQEKNWAGNKVYTNLFCADNLQKVTVRGRGILDMSTLPWHSKCPFAFHKCTDVLIEGIIVKDSPCWNMPVFGCQRVRYENIKQISHRENSDGINIVNSQDVTVENCFLRDNDDEICVKTTAPPPALEAKDITVRNCVVWNDRAYGIGITYETRQAISNVLYKDCDIIHDWGIGAIAIHMSDGATISGVRFEDVRVEDCRGRLVRLWIGKDMWGHDKERGRLNGVLFKNVALTGGPLAASELAGADAAHLIEDVTFDNLRMHGKVIHNAAAGKIHLNPHTKNIRFVSDTTPPAGAPKITSIRAAVPGDPGIVLECSKVEDAESGIDHYNIYRDGRPVAETKDWWSFCERGLSEETEYAYQVSAVNGAGLEGPKSAPAACTTLRDETKPHLANTQVLDATHLRISFSEPVNQSDATDASNYVIRGHQVKAAVLSDDLRSVTLTVDREFGTVLVGSVEVLKLRDRARIPNVSERLAGQYLYSTGLIGHWTLDEGQGVTAADSSRHGAHGKLVNLDPKQAWVAGKNGGALACDGENGFVEIAASAELRNVQNDSFTLAAWFKPAETPPGTGAAHNAAYAIVMKKGYHEGLMYNRDGKFVLCHWLAGDTGAGAASADSYKAGEFHHVAGVVDRAKGEARLYVNGTLVGNGSFDPAAQPRVYGDEPWRIGTASPGTRDQHAWPAKGVIDDVRMYRRALTEAEIGILAGTGQRQE